MTAVFALSVFLAIIAFFAGVILLRVVARMIVKEAIQHYDKLKEKKNGNEQ